MAVLSVAARATRRANMLKREPEERRRVVVRAEVRKSGRVGREMKMKASVWLWWLKLRVDGSSDSG
jgi:hypothetical protein